MRRLPFGSYLKRSDSPPEAAPAIPEGTARNSLRLAMLIEPAMAAALRFFKATRETPGAEARDLPISYALRMGPLAGAPVMASERVRIREAIRVPRLMSRENPAPAIPPGPSSCLITPSILPEQEEKAIKTKNKRNIRRT
jgi:hypothetical protein